MRNPAAATAALMMAWGAPAWGHAIIVSAHPTEDQQVTEGKCDIRIEFNSRVDKARSRLQLTAPSGEKTDVPIEQAGDPNVVTGTADFIAPGPYVLRWQVLAIDGHITRGDIPFIVGN